jgi:glyoxylase-like metal-dependent hydrolase (beta-lactamase superfamily II)
MLTCVEANRLRPEAIVLTHAHADHIAGIPEIQRSWPGLPVYLAEVEWSFLTDPASNLSILSGLELRVPVKTTKDLPPGGELQLGDLIWKVLDTSGHSPGGRTLYQSQAGVAIVGDALFAGSIGRIDFPHSNGQTLLRNIREQLLVLPGGTRVLSGHGPDTTIEHELRHNTFL